MLYLIISNPTPAKADDVKDALRRFLAWMEQLKQADKVKQFYPRVGRYSLQLGSIKLLIDRVSLSHYFCG